MIGLNPNSFRYAIGNMGARHFRIEMLKAGLDGVDRWTLLAKVGDRATADRVARDGFGGGVAVRIVEE